MNPNEIHQYKPEQGDQDRDQLQQQHQQVQEHQATQYYQLTQAQGHRQHVQGYHQQQPGQGHQQLHLQGVDQQDDVVDSRGESFGSLGHIQFTIIGQKYSIKGTFHVISQVTNLLHFYRETTTSGFLNDAEFKEFEPRLKFDLFLLKLYSIFQNLSRRSIETGLCRI